MTTEAPGYPPALMPRMTMRSTDARRADDMPTDFGVLTGKPIGHGQRDVRTEEQVGPLISDLRLVIRARSRVLTTSRSNQPVLNDKRA